MAVISGKDAYINGVHCLMNFQLTEDVALERYAASCTIGGTGVADGNVNWNGSANGIGHTPALLPTGTDFTFKGVVDNTAALAFDGTILVNQTVLNIPVAAGGPITWSSNFGAQGLLTEGSVGAADTAGPEAPSAKNGGIRIAANLAAIATPTVIDAIQNITVTMSRPEQTWIDAGVTKRLPGNLEVDLSFEVLDKSMANALYAKNAFGIVRVYVTATTYWEFGGIKFGTKGPITVDTSTRQPVGYTVNGMLSAVVPTALNTALTGWIKNPAGTYFFGTAPS